MSLVVILSLIIAFYVSWAIGANDVANAMGTSVGSGSLSLRKAVIIASVFEFLGAFFFGGSVAKTIGKEIVIKSAFDSSTFAIGMLATLLAVGIWMHAATLLGYPVSTTHSVIGGVVGFGIAAGGLGAVNLTKVSWIALSFIVSPLSGLIFSFIIFNLVSKFVYQGKGSVKDRIRYFFPWISTVLVVPPLFYLLSDYKFILIALLPVTLILSKMFVSRLSKATRTEDYFKYLQILAASYIAFSHGANDVANAIGPIFEITDIPLHYLLLLGASGVVLGILSKGHLIISTVGNKISQLTPSRGFIASWGASIVVFGATALGFPISTTHTLIGSIMGVAISKGFIAVNRTIVSEILFVWFVTMPLTALSSYFIYHFLRHIASWINLTY